MQSMDEIYQKYARMVYRYLFSLTRNEDLSEELTQETFYQALKSIHKYDGSCKISTWLCGIAKNQMHAYYRKHPETDELLADDSMGTQQSVNIGVMPSAESQVIDAVSHVELMRRLHKCPEPFREILYLRIFGNLSFKEIGDIVGRTENWARVTYYRGKERLRKEIEKDET